MNLKLKWRPYNCDDVYLLCSIIKCQKSVINAWHNSLTINKITKISHTCCFGRNREKNAGAGIIPRNIPIECRLLQAVEMNGKKCYIWSKSAYGAEIWILQKVDQKHLKRYETRSWRMMEKIC
jgi:hypothetical protein